MSGANYGQLLQNAAVQADGIELDFQADRCGKSYRIKQNSTTTFWRCFFYDWHEHGWIPVNGWPGERLRSEAIAFCNQHAVQKRLLNFLPTRVKFKANWGSIAAATGASIAGLL
jgi:hypothetical protein